MGLPTDMREGIAIMVEGGTPGRRAEPEVRPAAGLLCSTAARGRMCLAKARLRRRPAASHMCAAHATVWCRAEYGNVIAAAVEATHHTAATALQP